MLSLVPGYFDLKNLLEFCEVFNKSLEDRKDSILYKNKAGFIHLTV
jgi:hypothetical protein